MVAWGFLLILLTESLSLVRGLSATWLTIGWAICGVLVGFAYRKSAATKGRPVFSLTDRDLVDRLAMGFILASILITFVIAVFAVPSLWDAHSYHMPRVLHWAQNHTVAYYPTHIQRQLWSSPGAEFITLQFYVLAGTDRFIALVPWSAFVLSIAASSLIAKELRAPPSRATDGLDVCCLITGRDRSIDWGRSRDSRRHVDLLLRVPCAPPYPKQRLQLAAGYPRRVESWPRTADQADGVPVHRAISGLVCSRFVLQVLEKGDCNMSFHRSH